ncbi:uncharacterized protein [Eurosta solidaginis]|uniref:uncharacterized protein n=1 Tax=Eurosta solidaginis TaxID=178769 RepID=UPI003530691C
MSKIKNPNEDLLIPKWITVDYFEKVLTNDGEIFEKISNFTPVAATSAGENFTSIILRIHLGLELKDGSKRHKTYIMKTMLDDEHGGSKVNEMDLFPKELLMYEKYLPAFEELYRSAGKPKKLAPRCLFAETRDNGINFVFEDLSCKGFVNAERIKGLNMDEMRRSLQMLAEFHAATVVYFEKNGPYPDIYKFSFVKESGYEGQQKLFNMRAEEYKEAMKTWGLKDIDKYLGKFREYSKTPYPRFYFKHVLC